MRAGASESAHQMCATAKPSWRDNLQRPLVKAAEAERQLGVMRADEFGQTSQRGPHGKSGPHCLCRPVKE